METRKLLGALLCLFLGLGTAASAGETFKLGAFLQLTGSMSAYGLESRNSIELAVAEINAKGGLNGQLIQFIPYDTQGSAEEAVKIASRLIDVDKVNLVIGSVNSNEVLAAARYLNDAKIPTLGLGTSPTWMAEGWPYIFRGSYNNGLSALLVVDIMERLGMSEVAVFKGQDDASLSTARAFAGEVNRRGYEIVADESYDLGDNDFSAQVANIIDSEPHAVFLSVIGEAGPVIVKQLRQLGYTGIILYKESFMVAQVEIAGKDAATDILFPNPYVTYDNIADCDIPIVHAFLEKFQAKYGHPCKTDSAYRAWDTMMIIQEAARIAGANDRESIRAAIHKVNMPGLGGQLDFTDGSGEGYKKFNLFAFIAQKNLLLDKWIADGGYEAYKKKTGNEY
jgi:branched-chain amino acid transport system substrate-binding protein